MSNKMSGYIKLHRNIEHHWIWQNPRRTQWWIQLIFMAAWEPQQVSFGNNTFTLQRGQIATTYRILTGRFSCSNQAVFNFLAILETHKMIIKETCQKMTLITIVNYDLYQQDYVVSENQDATKKRTSSKCKIERKIEQIKEERKEERNIDTSLSPSRERDLEFFEELKISEVFFEQCAITLKIGISALKEYFQLFSAEMLLQEKFHNSSADYRQHFFNWVKIQLSKGLRQITNNCNGTGQKETANKREARRGTDVGNHTSDDFGGAF